MIERMAPGVKYRMPLKKRLVRALWPLIKLPAKLAVLICAIRGRYPWWMLTPDDPVSPFGSGTTPGASVEATQMAVYERFGRYVGDVVWLGWRNSLYGLSYWLKPDWLKDPNIRYRDLVVVDERTPGPNGRFEGGHYTEDVHRTGTVWVQCPDGTVLWETTKKFGPLFVISGYRLSAIASGAREDEFRARHGLPLANRPVHHPNMDGRPVFSIRTARTM